MNILLADDVEGWLKFHRQNLEKFLSHKTINIYEFSSAHDAYNFAFTFNDKIDLVITDLEMEHMYDEPAGAWLIENLKTIKATQNSRYIIISSSYNISFIAEEKDADGYIKKVPYRDNPEKLKDLLDEMFGAK